MCVMYQLESLKWHNHKNAFECSKEISFHKVYFDEYLASAGAMRKPFSRVAFDENCYSKTEIFDLSNQ